MAKLKQDCYGCIFRERIQGDAHSKCTNEWTKEDFKGKTKTLTATWNQWSFSFPTNFDPHWIKRCDKFTSTNAENHTTVTNQ